MADRIYRETEQQTLSPKGNAASKYGKLLYKVETDRKRIGLEILLRLAAAALAMFVALGKGDWTLLIATAIVLVIFCAWPLLHMGDRMELYENGILHLGNWYPVGKQTRVDWVGGRGFFLPTTWMGISNCPERINVSFMKDAEKLFNRAYGNTIFEWGE